MELNANTDMIIIKTIDGVNIQFNKDIIKQSKTISDMLDVNDDDSFVPLLHEKCTENIMILIKDFLTHIHYNPNEIDIIKEFLNSETLNSEWFTNFISIDIQMLFDTVIVSDYLDINILTNFICREIGRRINHASSDEMKMFFQQ
jgi:hypothetical protein